MTRDGPDGFTRRRFLQAGAATLTLAGLSPRLRAGDKKDPYNGFTVGAQTYCFRNFSAEQALKRTHDLGLRHVEIFPQHVPLTSTPEQVQSLLKVCREYGITPLAYGVQTFTRDHEANKKVFAFGKALGIRAFSADPDPDSFGSLDKLVEEFKIAVAIHPHGPQRDNQLHRWYSAEVILAAVKDHHPLIGSCLDTGHLIRAEQLGKKLDPAEQIRVMGPRNFGIHLKDHENKKKTDVVFGQGELNVPAVLRALKDVKFTGCLSLEYEANPEDPTPDLRACLQVLQQAVKAG